MLSLERFQPRPKNKKFVIGPCLPREVRNGRERHVWGLSIQQIARLGRIRCVQTSELGISPISCWGIVDSFGAWWQRNNRLFLLISGIWRVVHGHILIFCPLIMTQNLLCTVTTSSFTKLHTLFFLWQTNIKNLTGRRKKKLTRSKHELLAIKHHYKLHLLYNVSYWTLLGCLMGHDVRYTNNL